MFYWRVRTWDSEDVVSSWSSTRSFMSDRVNLTLSVSDSRVNVNSTLPLVTTGVYEYDGSDFVANIPSVPNSQDIYLELDVDIFEASGSAAAIQEAVDKIETAGGIGTVYLPAGIFNFIVDPNNFGPTNKPYGVLIPGGVNVIGQGNQSTILRESVDPPVGTAMFLVDGRNGLQTRISGIGFVGFVAAVSYTHLTLPTILLV